MTDKIKEALAFQELSEEEKQKRHILGRLYGPIADVINPTRNGRRYSEELWENVFKNPIMQEKFKNKVMYGELGHPVDREEVDMEKIAVSMPEPPKRDDEGHLIGYFDILDTPNGRILKTLCDYGSTLGISSRGTGDVVEDEVDPDTYDCECFDIVLIPAVESARLTFTESLDKKQLALKKALSEDLNKASEEEKKVMKEALNNLNINVEESKEECINESCTDKLTENLSVETTEASNAGTEELINNMTKILKEKVELENTVKELQEKLAVSDSKVNKLQETLNRNRSSIVRLTAIAQNSKKDLEEVSALKEELESKSTKIEELEKELESSKSQNLNESVKLKELSSAKTKTIKELSENIEKQKQGYETELASLKEDFEKKSAESSKVIEGLNEKVTHAEKLTEAYKAKANEFLDGYIAIKAKLIGVKPTIIKNQLAKNCSIEDVNSICESLQSYELSISKMNLNLDNRKVKVEVKESLPSSMINSDDIVDESLLSLAKRC